MPPRPAPPRPIGDFNWYQTALAETTIQLLRYVQALKSLEAQALNPVPIPVESGQH